MFLKICPSGIQLIQWKCTQINAYVKSIKKYINKFKTATFYITSSMVLEKYTNTEKLQTNDTVTWYLLLCL